MPELCDKIASLKKQNNPEKAQELLERLHKYALPLMRKYNLGVKTLSEFFPKNPNLLGINVNHGLKIAIRLRHAHNPNFFLPFEDLLGTMLHELTHNRHGPHDERFFAYLDRLRAEMQTMLNSGFKGDQWMGSGNRVGGTARAAGRYTGNAGRAGSAAKLGPGRRLGGGGGGETAVPLRIGDRRGRMLNAAERRRKVDISCPADTPLTEIEIVDLTRDETPQPAPQTFASSPPSSPRQPPIFIDLT